MPRSAAEPFTPERLDLADVRAVVAAVAGDRVEPAVLFSLATGVRHGELLALHYDDICNGHVRVHASLERGGAIVRAKSDRSTRDLALSATALRALALERQFQLEERLLAGGNWHDSGLVFASRTGTVMHPSVHTHRLSVCLGRAKLPAIRWHALRRMFAAVLLEQGVPLHRIRDLLGHAHIPVTEHYAYSIPADSDMGAVDDVLG